MVQSHPVPDLRNKFSKIEYLVTTDKRARLTKDNAVLNLEMELDAAECQAVLNNERLSHKILFDNVRNTIYEK